MAILFANGAVGTLQTPALVTDDTLHLTTGQGGRFPDPQPGDYFVLTLQNGSDVEIVHCTKRVADALTVTRAREGTTALTWLAGTVADMRVTAGLLQAFLQYAVGVALQLSKVELGEAGTLSGGTLSEVKIRDAEIKLSTLFIGEVKPADGNTAKSLRLPNGGGHPTVGASNAEGTSRVLTQDLVNSVNLDLRNTGPCLYLRDIGPGDLGAALHLDGNFFAVMRLVHDSREIVPFGDGSHPLVIDLTNGDLQLAGGWALKANGDAWSKMHGWLSNSFNTWNATKAAFDAHEIWAGNVHALREAQIVNLNSRVRALEAMLSVPPGGGFPEMGG